MKEIELRKLMSFVRIQGQHALSAWKAAVAGEYKADESPVTIVDTRINGDFIKFITRHHPGDSVLGEEQCVSGETDVVWVIDPLDGTRPFCAGMPNFAAPAIARVQNGQVTHAFVYLPVSHRLLYAIRGKGAWSIESAGGLPKKLRVAANTTFEKTTVFAQCRKSSLFDAFSLGESLTARKANNLSTGSIIEEVMHVARGGLALYEPAVAAVYHVDKCYDVAAPSLIVEEAGGMVTDFYGNPITDFTAAVSGALFSNGAIHEELVTLTRSCTRRV